MKPIGSVWASRMQLQPAAFDDLRVGSSSTRSTGASIPSFTKLMANGASTGIFIQSFGPGPQQHDTYGQIQLSHGRKPNTDIELHFHWFPTTNNVNVAIMEFEFAVANIGEAFPVAATGVVTPITLNIAAAMLNVHQITDITTLPGVGAGWNLGLSAFIVFRLSRLGGDGADTYTGNIGFLGLDAHIRVDALGSDGEYTKYLPE